MDQRWPQWARVWFAVTFVLMVAGVVLTLILAGQSSGGFGDSPFSKAMNQFAFFTIQSNLIVGVTSLMLAVRLDRTSVVFSVFRLIGLVAITVTFIIFQTILGRGLHLHGWTFLANFLVHGLVPIMSVVGWLVFGPRGLTSWRIAGLATIYPAAYIIFTVIRGPLASNWYPYAFVDFGALGYFRAAINSLLVCLLFAGLTAVATWLDKRLPGGRTANIHSQPARARKTW